MVAIDPAKRAGIAYNVDSDAKIIVTTVVVGTPQEQRDYVLKLNHREAVIEDLPRMRNMNTTKSLLMRIGYIALSLEDFGKRVTFVRVQSARRWIGAKSKKDVQRILSRRANCSISSDEADAAALLLFKLQRQPNEVSIQSRK